MKQILATGWTRADELVTGNLLARFHAKLCINITNAIFDRIKAITIMLVIKSIDNVMSICRCLVLHRIH